MTSYEAIAAVKSGLRVKNHLSQHDIPLHPECPPYTCKWRTLVCCDNTQDVVECAECGRQKVIVCNHDGDA